MRQILLLATTLVLLSGCSKPAEIKEAEVESTPAASGSEEPVPSRIVSEHIGRAGRYQDVFIATDTKNGCQFYLIEYNYDAHTSAVPIPNTCK